MEPDRFDYSPIIDRPAMRFPGDARIALWIVPNIEHYEMLPPTGQARDPWPRMPHPDILGYGARDYGNRVGLWRMMDLFDRYAVPATMSLNIAVYERYPEIMEACEARGWGVLAHGLYNTRFFYQTADDHQRAVIADCVDRWRRHTGRMLPGWFTSAASPSISTTDLVAEAGFKYISDWYHDDQPTLLRTAHGDLVSVPYQMDLNDAVTNQGAFEGDDFARMTIDQFDCLYRDAEDGSGRVMCVALHPYIMGHPHRIRHLERAIRHMLGHDGVWMATGEQIADWYIAQHVADPSTLACNRHGSPA